MRLFKSERTSEPAMPPAHPRMSGIDGWSDRDLTSLYSVASVRNLKHHEPLFVDLKGTESFFVLLDGALQIVVRWDGHGGRPGIFRKGDCVAPLPKSLGLEYGAEAVEPTTLIEITPAMMNLLPETTQLNVYKAAVAATSRINAYIRTVNGEVSSNNALLAAYIERQNIRSTDALQTEFVREFLNNIPRMPAYGMDLMVKLMDENCSVQEVVDGIKSDPSVASILLRSVNSARFCFDKKIESFYHACMILGMNNIYDLILHEAVQAAMPETENTKQIHRHSCLITALCNEIATASKETQAQTSSTIGLLHDVGKGVQVLMKMKHSEKSAQIDNIPSAKLGANLLRMWGIPTRICDAIEHQQQPEYTHPDQISEQYRREIGVLHIAHILEALLAGEPIAPEGRIYTRDYMTALGLSNTAPEEFLKNTVLPSMAKNRHRLPQQVLAILPLEGLSGVRSKLS